MRARLLRGLVDALGERGALSLPLVPQMLPTMPIGDLSKLGHPVGIPVGAFTEVAAVAAERAGAFYVCPSGMVLRIDRIQSRLDGASLSIGYGASPGAGTYSILDTRFGRPAVSSTRIVSGINPFSAPFASWAAAFDIIRFALVPQNEWYEGPIYIGGPGNPTLAIWQNTDATAAQFNVVGEIFELG